MKSLSKLTNRLNRKRRTRAKITGTAERPRLTISRSLQTISVQLIDDAAGRTIAAASTAEAKQKSNLAGAKALGELIAKKAKDAKVTTVVFDRNGYLYHGRIKAVADAAREGGLQF